MKKFFLLFLSILITTIGFSQKNIEEDIPTIVKNNFKKKFSKAEEVEWSIDKETFEVDFSIKEMDHTAVYDEDGKLLELEVEIEEEQLPSAVRAYLKKNYPKEAITESTKIVDSNKQVKYEVGVKKVVLFFNEQGEVIAEEK